MAYFANGTSFDFFYERQCENCVHEPDDVGDYPEDGCPVILAHLLFSYELCNSNEAGKQILDILIPMRDCQAGDCKMFHAIDGRNCNPNQMPLGVSDATYN